MGGMTDDLYARLRRDARRIMGIARCADCGALLRVAEDDVPEARDELRDEGWVEAVPWDGEDATSLAHWRCPACQA